MATAGSMPTLGDDLVRQVAQLCQFEAAVAMGSVDGEFAAASLGVDVSVRGSTAVTASTCVGACARSEYVSRQRQQNRASTGRPSMCRHSAH